MNQINFIHPYPAMIPDQVSEGLISEFAHNKATLLDPFCGSGRIVFNSSLLGHDSVGIDINPLACLIAKSKNINIPEPRFSEIYDSILLFRSSNSNISRYDVEPNRKVNWFSEQNKNELCQIIEYINQNIVSYEELVFLSTVLSATVREVSFCRNDQWKLHRLSKDKRDRLTVSAWDVFLRRLMKMEGAITTNNKPRGSYSILNGDTKNLCDFPGLTPRDQLFDIVITSPPYGDSKTTVQYGAMSSLCLGVLMNIKDLNITFISGQHIDNLCLGGDQPYSNNKLLHDGFNLKDYWHGGQDNSAISRVISFSNDLIESTSQICKQVKRDGTIIFVVSRRLVGGWRYYIDKLLIDTMNKNGWFISEVRRRKIISKVAPAYINRLARLKGNNNSRYSRVPTMREEYILIFNA